MNKNKKKLDERTKLEIKKSEIIKKLIYTKFRLNLLWERINDENNPHYPFYEEQPTKRLTNYFLKYRKKLYNIDQLLKKY